MKLSRNLFFGICAISFLFVFMACNEDIDIGANWTLESVSADGTTLSTEDGSLTQTLTLFADSESNDSVYRISGFSGVNHFNGTLTMADKTAQVGLLAVTMMMGPEADGQAENIFLTALQNGGKVSITKENGLNLLTITNSEKKSSLVFMQTLLENTAWNLSMYNMGNAVTNIPEGIEGASIAFAPEGKLFGSTGVNRLSASYTFTTYGNITFSMPTLTRMAAPTEELATFEMRQVELLEQAVSYELSGSTLTLRNATGETLLVYEK